MTSLAPKKKLWKFYVKTMSCTHTIVVRVQGHIKPVLFTVSKFSEAFKIH